MHLFLVRHGESVDNVAGLYAGSRDSPLTSHGVLQAQRLGAHLALRGDTIGPVRHVFSSNLQRAVKTAQALLVAQPREGLRGCDSPRDTEPPSVVQLAELREKDFGSSEGRGFGSAVQRGRSSSPRADGESYDEMNGRVDRFIDDHLMAVMSASERPHSDAAWSIVVVAHGIILDVLLRRLLARYAPGELERLSTRGGDGVRRREFLSSWNNTGYVEIRVVLSGLADPGVSGTGTPEDALPDCGTTHETSSAGRDLRMTVLSINCTTHLQGLRKTRGGIGSAKFDEKQKTMDAFLGRPTKRPGVTQDTDR